MMIKIPTLFLAMLVFSVTAFGRGGTNTGGSDAGSEFTAYVSKWCSGEATILEQYLTQAKLSDLDHDLMGTILVLQAGLQKALDDAAGNAQTTESLTYRTLARGLEITQALLDLSRADVTGTGIDATRIFLYAYYDLIINRVAPLDIGQYLAFEFQYPHCHEHCEKFDQAAFEAQFIDYNQAQMTWFFSKFVTRLPIAGEAAGQGLEYYPLYSAKVVLKVAEYLTKYTGDDLTESLWQAKYSCAIGQLRGLNDSLAKHNSGNMAFFRNDRYAINIAAAKMETINEQLATGCGR